MGAKIGFALAMALLATAVWPQGLELGDYQRASAINCVEAYPSPEKQEACFSRANLLKEGRTPEQIRTYVAEIRAQREKEQQALLGARKAKEEQETRQRQEAQTRARDACLEQSAIPASEADLVKAQKIRLGMSEAALLCSWGRPQSVNRSVGAWGERKQYVYGDGVYVYVDNGKIASWQD